MDDCVDMLSLHVLHVASHADAYDNCFVAFGRLLQSPVSYPSAHLTATNNVVNCSKAQSEKFKVHLHPSSAPPLLR